LSVRIPWLRRDELDEEQRALYDAIAGSPRSSTPGRIPLTDPEGRMYGPWNPLLFTPQLGDALQVFGSQVRFATSLSPRLREIAILELARSRESEFEWMAHRLTGLAVGISEDEVEAIRRGTPPESFDSVDRLVLEATGILVAEGDLSKLQFDALEAALGLRQVIDLVILVGYYELLALLLKVTRTPLPDGCEPVFETDPDDT